MARQQGVVEFFHVDVFSAAAFNGNSLAVFPNAQQLDARQMLTITQELKHFESIFLTPCSEQQRVRARVFDMYEELDFAGHPLIGAGAVMHHISAGKSPQQWFFELNKKTVSVKSKESAGRYQCELDQGAATYMGIVKGEIRDRLLACLNLKAEDLDPELPLEVVSTGLAYLIVPVKGALARSRIVSAKFEQLLQQAGAQFAYILDTETLEGRHWNNDGVLEDVATGSAAGTVGAYLAKYNRVELNESFVLRQGRFVGRPSEIDVRAMGSGSEVNSVVVGGSVAIVAQAQLLALP